MRNSTTIVLLGILGVICVLVFMFVDPAFKDRLLVMILLFATIIAAMAFSIVVGQKHSPHASGYGFCTSLEKVEAINTVTLCDPENPEEDIILDIHAMNGCQPFWIKGGGRHGYFVVRRDLKVTLEGDRANVWIDASPPDVFTMEAGPKSPYKNLAQLPKEVYMALRAAPGWHDKAKVLVFFDPPMKKIKDNGEKRAFPYKKQLEMANEKLVHHDIDRNELLETNSRFAEANKRNAVSYANREEGRGNDEEEARE